MQAEYAITSLDWVPQLDAECTTFGSNAQFVSDMERDVRGPGMVSYPDAMSMTGAILLKVTNKSARVSCTSWVLDVTVRGVAHHVVHARFLAATDCVQLYMPCLEGGNLAGELVGT